MNSTKKEALSSKPKRRVFVLHTDALLFRLYIFERGKMKSKRFKITPEQKVTLAKAASAIFSVMGIIGTIGAFFVDDICTNAAIDEAVDARLKEHNLN